MTVTYNKSGELTIDGTSLKTIAQSFGTPTIVYDENQIRQQMRRYHQAFQHNDIGYVLSYASKAFTCIQMIKLVEEEDFDLDVVSEGELYTAIEAGYDLNAFTSMVTTKQSKKFNMPSHKGLVILS